MSIVTRRTDSDLGCWIDSRWRPPHLAGLVDVIWHSEGAIAHARERIFPNALVELVVNLGDEPYRLVEGAGSEVLWSCLTGVQSGPIVINGPPRHCVLGIRLHPAGAYALFARPMRELTDFTVDLRDLVGRAADDLGERCHGARSPEQRIHIAAEWVAGRVAGSRGVDEGIAWAVARIEGSGGAVSIGELRDRIGLSKSRLVSAFRDQIGVAPKTYARIVRLRRLTAVLDRETGSLADAALDAGYYDQSHMTTEFRELTGLTPREFLATRYPEGTTAYESS